MKILSRALCAMAILFPLFGRLLPGLRFRPETLLNEGVVLAMLSIGVSVFANSNDRKRTVAAELFKPLVIFSCFYFLIWGVKGLVTDQPFGIVLGHLRNFLCGPLIGFALIMTLAKTVGRNEERALAVKLLNIFATMLVIQVAISAVESLRGESFADYGENGMGELAGRDVLQVTGGGMVDRFGFKLPFYGMLGQHNYFGDMLINYNALWVAGFLLTRQRRFLLLLGLTLFAVFGNSTRTSVICVLLLDAVAFFQLIGGTNSVLRLGKASLVLMITLGTISMVSQRFDDYAAESNTFDGRVDLWLSVFTDISNGLYSPMEWVFGSNMEHVEQVGLSFRGISLGSVENQYLYMFCFTGLAGLAMFIWAMFAPLWRIRQRCGPDIRIVVSTIIATYAISFVTLDLHFSYSSFTTFVVVLFVLGAATRSDNLAAGVIRRRPEDCATGFAANAPLPDYSVSS